ncbi:MAG: Rpn family recombination-promoting nuclease/putative transposase [Planctomyces sp.]
MPIGIIPLVDYAFKMMLGNQHHPGVTIHFLNAVLAGRRRITRIEFVNPIQLKRGADDKLCNLDILAVDDQARRLNIEVQIALPAGMAQRLVYYVSRTFVDQLQEGQNYTELRPSICICVLAGQLFVTPPALHLDFRLRDHEHSLTLTDDLQIHLLQLNHLQVTEETVYHATPVERWAWFLRHAEELTSAQVARLFPDKEFSEAAEVLEMIAQTPQHLVEYNARLKAQRDEEARILYAQQQGKADGRAEGRAEGIDIGIERGVLIGRITLLQQLLQLPAGNEQLFAECSIDDLHRMSTELQQRFSAGRT